MAEYLDSGAAIDDCVWRAVHAVPAVDLLTGLPAVGIADNPQAWGIDALLTTPDLVEALFRTEPRTRDNPGKFLTRKDFAAMPLNVRADMVWHRLFLSRAPLSEDTREVLTVLGMLHLNPDERRLENHRAAFAKFTWEKHWERLRKTANLELAVTLCDPLRPEDAKVWPAGEKPAQPAGIRTALLLDGLLDWENARAALLHLGALKESSGGDLNKSAQKDVAVFLSAWVKRTRAVYLAADWCNGFFLSAKGHAGAKILRKCVLPFCAVNGLPLLLAFGGRAFDPAERQPVNFVAESVAALCADFPKNRYIFVAFDLAVQRALLSLARRFPQIAVLGGAGENALPGALAESARAGLETLGSDFAVFHSAATVPEQLVSRWAHARWVVGKTLQQRYHDLARTGWKVTEKEVAQDADNLLRGTALRLLAPKTGK